MSGLNRVLLIGNIGQDPSVRFSASGTAVCNLRVAVTERRKQGDTWADHTEWVDVVTFGKTAENAGAHLAKGRQVLVEGRLQQRSYKDKEGKDRHVAEVVADQVLFLGGAPKKEGSPEDAARESTKAAFARGPSKDARGEW